MFIKAIVSNNKEVKKTESHRGFLFFKFQGLTKFAERNAPVCFLTVPPIFLFPSRQGRFLL